MKMNEQTIDLASIVRRRCTLCAVTRYCVGLSLADGEQYIYICSACAEMLYALLTVHEQEEKWMLKNALDK